MQKIILYGTPYCPQVYTVRRELGRNDIDYEYINIREHKDAAERVRQINNGYESVPTLVFSDGSTLTEPSKAELLARLREQGEEIEASAVFQALATLLESPGMRLIAMLIVLAGILLNFQALTWIGLFLMAVSILSFFLHKRA